MVIDKSLCKDKRTKPSLTKSKTNCKGFCRTESYHSSEEVFVGGGVRLSKGMEYPHSQCPTTPPLVEDSSGTVARAE